MIDAPETGLILPERKRKLLVVGCGRSGTLYSAEVFRTLGLDMLHERDPLNGTRGEGKDGLASWFLTVNDPHPPFGPNRMGLEFQYILHQVRHPLKVIASFAQFILQQGGKSAGFVAKYIPDFQEGLELPDLTSRQKLILQASRYWYHWNRMSEQIAGETIQLERMEQELPRICDSLGIEYRPERVETVSKKTNERGLWVKEAPWLVTWQEVAELDPRLYENIRHLAAGYGYDE